MNSKGRPAVLITALALFAGTEALGQASRIFRTVEAQPGTPVRLGVYVVLRPDCSVGSPPEIRVTSAPSKGALAVQSTKLKTSPQARCPEVEVPVQIVLYRANPGGIGSDEVSFEVTNPDGRVLSHIFNIRITNRPRGPRKRQPTIEL